MQTIDLGIRFTLTAIALLMLLAPCIISCNQATTTFDNLPASDNILASQNTIQKQTANIFADNVRAMVGKVVDGDTIWVSINNRNYKVRYIGMDTPETANPFKPVEYFGKEACAKNRELVENKIVRLEKDVSETVQPIRHQFT